MNLSKAETDYLIAELTRELGAKKDGSNKNLICKCPSCNKEGKFGIFVGRETARKKQFMSNCFSCGLSTHSLEQLLSLIGRGDLMISPVAEIKIELNETLLFPLESEKEIDDTLRSIRLPDFYRRTFAHPYCKGRGFVYDDYDYFEVGSTGRLNYRYNDYVIFPVIDDSNYVGYVARHAWSKAEIDSYNRKAKSKGDFIIPRFRNSTENDFTRLLYNYDAVISGETQVVILVEGVFDVIALTRKLDLYDNKRVVPVATFGKKMSDVQIYKLQCKEVPTVVVGYDGDAVEAIKRISGELASYFSVMIADIPDANKDWEDLSEEEIYHVFAYNLRTPLEYKLKKLQLWKN